MEKRISANQSLANALTTAQKGDVFWIEDGVYDGKLEIQTSDITLKAVHPGQVFLRNHDYYHKIMTDGNECNTFRTYTLYIGADHVRLEGLVIQNQSVPSSVYGQAVALHADGNDFQCVDCIIESSQDTLFIGPLPEDLQVRYRGFYSEKFLKNNDCFQQYQNCTIIGDVDFIFGGGVAFFDHCRILSKVREHPHSFICAPSHKKELPYGFLFHHCQIASLDRKETHSVYLARPWRDYGCCAFIDCELDSHIHPEGFHSWEGTHREQTARFYESASSSDKERVSWAQVLSFEESQEYIRKFKEYFHQNIEKKNKDF